MIPYRIDHWINALMVDYMNDDWEVCSKCTKEFGMNEN